VPNGGSDCCGTCWFNKKNKGQAGLSLPREHGEDYCIIRDVPIADPFWTYCSNHPYRFPDKEKIPIGPIYASKGKGREVLHASPDNEHVRNRLLTLLEDIKETPSVEYPSGVSRDEVIAWQLGEFRDERALPGLQRILHFDPLASSGEPTFQTREHLIQAAKDAVDKIQAG